jgi:hypothetical protein
VQALQISLNLLLLRAVNTLNIVGQAFGVAVVLQHNKDSVMAAEFLDQEMNHLDKVLHALISSALEEAGRGQIKLCCQTAICHRLNT